MEKTQILSVSRFPESAGTSFDFLGFEFRWEDNRKGKEVAKPKESKGKLHPEEILGEAQSTSDRTRSNHGKTGRPAAASIFLFAGADGEYL